MTTRIEEKLIRANPIPERIDLRKPKYAVKTWDEFVRRYRQKIENVEIQLERGQNYKNYKKLSEIWQENNIQAWFLVREILHRKNCVLVKNDFPPVGLPKCVSVYTFWINDHELPQNQRNIETYKNLLAAALNEKGVNIEDSIYYMRDNNQMSIPQYPHFHVYINDDECKESK